MSDPSKPQLHTEASSLRQELLGAHEKLHAWRRQWLDTARQRRSGDQLQAAALCAHAVCIEDATIQVILKGARPLFTQPEHQLAALHRQVDSDAFANLDVGLGPYPVSLVLRRFIVIELVKACRDASDSQSARRSKVPARL